MQIKHIGDAIGRNTKRVADTGIGGALMGGPPLQAHIVVAANADKDTGLATGQAVRVDTGRFNCFPSHFQQQALLWVDCPGFQAGDAKKVSIKFINLFEKTTPAGAHFARGWGGSIKRGHIPALVWHLGNRVVAGQQILPEGRW